MAKLKFIWICQILAIFHWYWYDWSWRHQYIEAVEAISHVLSHLAEAIFIMQVGPWEQHVPIVFHYFDWMMALGLKVTNLKEMALGCWLCRPLVNWRSKLRCHMGIKEWSLSFRLVSSESSNVTRRRRWRPIALENAWVCFLYLSLTDLHGLDSKLYNFRN